MNLRQIEYFMAVATHLNFTKASKSLYISQPSLSKQISLLEEELGVLLLHRNRHSVHLTSAGGMLLEEFGKINSQIDLTVEKVKRIACGIDGTLTIGCVEGINIDAFLPCIVNSFSSEYNDVSLSIERFSFKVLREKLQAGTLDIIFTLSFDIENLDGLKFKNVDRRLGSIVLSSSHSLASREGIDLKDLCSETLLVISPNECEPIFESTKKRCKEIGLAPVKIKAVPNVSSLLNHIEFGMGFALLDRSIGEKYGGKLKFYDVPIPGGEFYVVCCWKVENLNPTIIHFIEMLPCVD